jgi:hypothetical protein
VSTCSQDHVFNVRFVTTFNSKAMMKSFEQVDSQ